RAWWSAAVITMAIPFVARAQDTTFRGITINGAFGPGHDKYAIVVLPMSGAFADSVRAMVQRDLENSDRFVVVAVDSADQDALRAASGAGLNYPMFTRLGASVVVQIMP